MSSTPIPITPTPSDIDELGHVNNAVWARWIQDVATVHWRAVAAPVRHIEIRSLATALGCLGIGEAA